MTVACATASFESCVQARHGAICQRPMVSALPVTIASYRVSNLVERFFNKIEQCRRVATRYDKLAANYLAFVKLASIRIWLRANESTPWQAGLDMRNDIPCSFLPALLRYLLICPTGAFECAKSARMDAVCFLRLTKSAARKN